MGIKKHFNKEYREHLHLLGTAQKKFEAHPNPETATKLSNMKNNEFKKAEEVFSGPYLDKMVKEGKKEMKDNYGKKMGEHYFKLYFDGYDHIPYAIRLVGTSEDKKEKTYVTKED